jgi:hypothetical protein
MMMGACWVGSHVGQHSGDAKTNCQTHQSTGRAQEVAGADHYTTRAFKHIYEEHYGSPPLVDLGRYKENKHGFLEVG